MKNTTRWLSLVLALIMCASLVSLTGLASEEVEEAAPIEDAAPAEDGYAYYHDDEQDEDIVVEAWVYAEESVVWIGDEPVTLRVITDNSRTDISYEWFLTEGWRGEQAVEGADQATYTVKPFEGEYREYICRVTGTAKNGDGETDSVEVRFYTYSGDKVRREPVSIHPKGNDGWYSAEIIAAYGESVTLEVETVCDEDVTITDVQYHWRRIAGPESEDEDALDTDEPKWTLGQVTESADYYVDAEFEYTYEDPDTGDTTTGSAYGWSMFSVMIDSGLEAKLDLSVLGDALSVTEKVYTREDGMSWEVGNSYYDIFIERNTPLTLKAIIPNGIETKEAYWYSWGEPNEWGKPEINLEDGTQCSVTPGAYLYERFAVTDLYGNECRITVAIRIENHFSAWPDGAAENEREITLIADPNGELALKVNTAGDDLNGLTYSWYRIESEEMRTWLVEYVWLDDPWSDGPRELSPQDTLIVAYPAENAEYACTVTDRCGNEETVVFRILVAEDLDGDETLTVQDAAAYLRSAAADKLFFAAMILRKMTGLTA